MRSWKGYINEYNGNYYIQLSFANYYHTRHELKKELLKDGEYVRLIKERMERRLNDFIINKLA